MVTTTCQRIRVALVALCVVCSSQTWALGLGEIDVESALNERFVGQIEVLDHGDLQASEIIVSMASVQDFQRIGVERFFYLTDLSFDVVVSPRGAVVNVKSSKPIAEPYLNFIVEVHWPSGRMLKEFTVLLDPPTFGQAAAPAVISPIQSSQDAATARIQRDSGAQETQDSGTRVTISPRQAPRPGPAAARTVEDGTIMTTRDDTLWKIANSTVGAGVSVNQQMLAIQRLNRQAFIKDNINLLKAGFVLRLPTEDEALELADRDATQEVVAQLAEWRSGDFSGGRGPADATQLVDVDGGELRSQVDATANVASNAGADGTPRGEVRIVANSGQLAAGSNSGTDESVTQLIEDKDALNRQVDELTYQLDREKEIATNQIAVKERQLDVKDQQIAELQEQLKQVQAAVAAQQQNQEQSPKVQAAPTPWWSSPMVLGGVIGVLVLVLVGLLIAIRRNRGAEDVDLADEPIEYDDALRTDALAHQYVEDEEEDVGDFDDDEAGPVEPTIGDGVEDYDEDDAEEVAPTFADADDDYAGEDERTPADSKRPPSGDVIGEADIYIAYGRYGQAANLLLTTLNSEPSRDDARLKLLEVYVETNDRENFAQHAEFLVENCDDEEVLLACRELESRLGENELDYEGPQSTAAPRDAGAADGMSARGTVDDFALELEDLEDVASVDDEPDGQGSTADNGAEEFQLEFDEDDLVGDDLETQSESRGELGGDLGMDFNPDRDVAQDADGDDSGSDTLDDDLADISRELGADAKLDGAGEDEKEERPDVEFDLSDDNVVSLDDESVVEVAADAQAEVDEDFDFEGSDNSDVNTTKLDLAEAYIDMGDEDGARDILHEVVEEGSPEQQQKAQGMLAKIA